MSFRSCLSWSVDTVRLTLTSTSIALSCEVVWYLRQCMSSVTLYSRPDESSLTATRFQAFTGVINGNLINGFTIEIGAMMTLVTVNM